MVYVQYAVKKKKKKAVQYENDIFTEGLKMYGKCLENPLTNMMNMSQKTECH